MVYAKAYASVAFPKCLCLTFLINFFTINKKNKGSEEGGIVEDSALCHFLLLSFRLVKETKEARRGEEPWRQASGRINAHLGLRQVYAGSNSKPWPRASHFLINFFTVNKKNKGSEERGTPATHANMQKKGLRPGVRRIYICDSNICAATPYVNPLCLSGRAAIYIYIYIYILV